VYLLVKAFYSKKYYHYLFAGLLAGLTVLGRENFIPIVIAPCIMLIFPWLRKHVKYQQVVIYFAGILIFIMPIIFYNYLQFNSPEIIPGNFAHIFNFYHGKEALVSGGKLSISIIERVPSQIKMFSSSYEIPNSLSFYAHQEIITMLGLLLIPFNLILGGAFLALFWDFKKLRTIFVGGMALGYFLTIIYFSMFYRFRVVDVPLLCVLIAISLHVLNRQKARQIVSIIFLFAFFFLAYISPNKLRSGSERRAVVRILIDGQNYYRAEELIDKLIEDKIPLNNLERHLIK
jgi:hypothetical protein